MSKYLKIVFVFGIISVGIDFLKKMIFSHFEMERLLNVDFLIYDVIIEFTFLVLSALFTLLVFKKNTKKNLGVALFTALIFGLFYGLLALIGTSVMMRLEQGSQLELNIYNSFLNYIPNGFSEGILFIVVTVALKTRQ